MSLDRVSCFQDVFEGIKVLVSVLFDFCKTVHGFREKVGACEI